MKNKIMLLVILCMCVGLSGCASKDDPIWLELETEQSFISSEGIAETEELEIPENASEETEVYIYVYMCGAVKLPGVYALKENSRICDGLELAGGFTDKACKEYINLAQVLSDGQKIYIPTEEEVIDRGESTWKLQDVNTGSAITNAEKKINLNTATKEQLMTLPGIGSSKADCILAYRTEHGGFSSVEDITEVTGIKEATFLQMKEYIIVE